MKKKTLISKDLSKIVFKISISGFFLTISGFYAYDIVKRLTNQHFELLNHIGYIGLLLIVLSVLISKTSSTS